MSTPPRARLTAEEYLELDEIADVKSEFYQGEMFAMAGSTYEHNLIGNNTGGHLRDALRGRPCGVSNSDMRIHTPRTGLYTYADVVVVCGEPLFLERNRTTLVNPTVLVEVLSPSTEAYDRGRKFEHYESIESLREYVLIASDRVSVMVHRRRSESEWLTITATLIDGAIELESAGCRLSLREVYDKVEFPANSATAV